MKSAPAVLLTLFLWALIPIIDKVALRDRGVPPLTGMTLRLIAGLLAMAVVLALRPDVRQGFGTLSWRTAWAFGASGFLSLVLAQVFYYEALKDNEVGKMFPLLFGGAPVVGMVLAWIFLGEQISRTTALGGVLIAIGSALMVL